MIVRQNNVHSRNTNSRMRKQNTCLLYTSPSIPLSIKDAGVSEKEFYDKLDEIVKLAFDDQCTGANPVYPLMSEIREIYIKAYNGDVD